MLCIHLDTLSDCESPSVGENDTFEAKICEMWASTLLCLCVTCVHVYRCEYVCVCGGGGGGGGLVGIE